MPVENERKYVLEPTYPDKFFNAVQHITGAKAYEYKQGYLSDSCRIRSIEPTGEYLFTFKTKVNGELIEIENAISEEDFRKLWTQVTKVITKTRVKVPHGEYTWEVDFFRKPNKEKFYLIMAEVELPAGVMNPKELPSFITDNLLHEVEYGDKRFNNKQLSKPSQVKLILDKIRLDKEMQDGKL